MTKLNKRILSGVLGLAIAFATTGSYRTNAENEKLAGDINADGVVTSSDYPSMVKYFTNQIESDKISLINADINEDGKVNIVDVIMLKEALLTPKVPETTTTTVVFTEPVTTTSVSEVTTTIPETTTTKAGTTVTESVTTVSESVTVTSATEKTTAEPTATTIVTTTPVVTTAESITTVAVTSTPKETTSKLSTGTTTLVTTTPVTTTTMVSETSEITTTTAVEYNPDITPEEIACANRLNEIRAEKGMPELALDKRLCFIADERAVMLSEKFDARLPDGRQYTDLLAQYKAFKVYTYQLLAMYYDSGEEFASIVKVDVLTRPQYTKMGIGSYILNGDIHNVLFLSE